MNIAIILAGGTGSRVGEDIPKQFIEIYGKPILAYTLETFQNHEEIDAVEVVCIEKYINNLNDIIEKYGLSKVHWITKGGHDFQHSVINGINYLNRKIDNKDIVLVHYGASPFVSDEIISDGIRVAKEKGNATSAVPFYLLAGSNDDGIKSTKWLDREKIMALNCPHCFSYEYITQLYKEATEKNILDKVEPHTTSLMYSMNRTIYFSKGDQTNIKITTKEDLDLFRGFVLLKTQEKL